MPVRRTTTRSAAASLDAAVAAARSRLDAHTREMIAWHFDPSTGCPFWLDFAERLGWDPREHVHSYADLDKFPPFQDEWLRGGPVRRWVPRGLLGRPVYVFETGGSTGVPKTRVNIDDFRIDYEQFSETLDDTYFPRGSDWLMLGPTGPRRLRLAVEHLAQYRGGICFCVDLDPRWVVRLTREGRLRELHDYKSHVIDQALRILRSHPNIRCLFATPRLLEALCEKISLVRAGISGVFCGGTSMTPQFHRFAVEELLENGPPPFSGASSAAPCPAASAACGPRGRAVRGSVSHGRAGGEADRDSGGVGLRRQVGADRLADAEPACVRGPRRWPKIAFCPTYGNTLMGLAASKPFDPADNYALIYHAPQPRAVIEIVDPASSNDPDAWYRPPGARPARRRSGPGDGGQRHRIVDYGEWGRVRLTTLTREFFMPRFLERDEARRAPPCGRYPWDGAADVRPFSGLATPIVEGVY